MVKFKPWEIEQVFRGDGTTTRQMKAAPQDAVYVWPNRVSLSYALDLAKKLGRNDLNIMTKDSAFADGGYRLFGFPRRIVLDHATFLSGREFSIFYEMNQRAKMRENHQYNRKKRFDPLE